MKTTAERFWEKVHGGDVAECWQWAGALTVKGYGQFWNGGRSSAAHRWAYQQVRADIPAGLSLDHLCQNRACVNPWHLEPVTSRVNTLRGNTVAARKAAQTHCQSGHELNAANTYKNNKRGRQCITCARRRAADHYAATKPAAQQQSA